MRFYILKVYTLEDWYFKHRPKDLIMEFQPITSRYTIWLHKFKDPSRLYPVYLWQDPWSIEYNLHGCSKGRILINEQGVSWQKLR